MIEPGVRYLPMVQMPPQPQVSLEAAVDLTKKSSGSWSHHISRAETEHSTSNDDREDDEDVAGPHPTCNVDPRDLAEWSQNISGV